MVASCYRRSGDYTAALEKYKWIHQHFPDDTDCKIESMKKKCVLRGYFQVMSSFPLTEH